MSGEFLRATAAETSPSVSLMIVVVCFAVDCCTCQQEKSYLASPIPSFLQHANASSDSPGRVQFFQMLSVSMLPLRSLAAWLLVSFQQVRCQAQRAHACIWNRPAMTIRPWRLSLWTKRRASWFCYGNASCKVVFHKKGRCGKTHGLLVD